MMRLYIALTMLVVVVATAGVGHAQQVAAFDSKASRALLVEDSTGTVLFAKSEDNLIPPASLSKLMTAEYVFHELKEGRITPDTEFKVSEYSWRTGGALSRTSTMFAALNSSIKVSDLLQGVVVQLANDGCMILAEGLAGSDQAFSVALTKRAREIGLQHSVFANASGLPNPESKVSMRELVLLARHIHKEYPEQFKLYAQPDFEWNKIRQRNRNPLLGLDIGVDGMVSGFAEDSGYAVVATAARNGTRLFLAMSGLKTDKERAEESRRMLEWGFSNFTKHTVFKSGEIIAEAPVFGGSAGHVSLMAAETVDIFIPTDNPDRIRARIAYRWPLKAPVKSGQTIGALTISVGEKPVRTIPVFAANDVGTGTLISKALDGLKELLFFWL